MVIGKNGIESYLTICIKCKSKVTRINFKLEMKKIIFTYIVIVVLMGLTYGWLIVKYPIVAQIIAGGMGLSFLFVLGLALFPLSKIK